MPSMKITRKVLAGLTPKDRAYVQYDSELPGFGLRVTPNGAKSWIVEYRPGGGRRSATKRMTLGSVKKLTPEQAREQAENVLARATLGGDPASDKQAQRAAVTMADLIQLYMDDFVRPKKKARTADLYGMYFRRHVTPTFGTRKARDVTIADVARLHRKIGAKTPATANRVLMLLSGLYSWAGHVGEVDKAINPTHGVEKFREQPKDRFLSGEEITRLGEALREAETTGIPWVPDETKSTAKHAPKPENRRTKLEPSITAAIRLLLLTGCRLREVLHLRWQEVDMERGMLHLPDSKTGRKVIILSTAAMAVFAGMEREGLYVVRGQDPKKPRHDLHKPWATVSKRAELVGVRLHDLRHTFASVGAGGGFGLPIIGKLLGHSQPSTTARYAHLDADPVRKASDRIGGAITAALNGGSGS